MDDERTSPNPSRRGFAAVVVGATTIGLAPIFVRLAEPASPFVIGFYRMAIALPFALTIALVDRGPWDPGGVRRALLAGVFFFGDLSLWHTAIRRTSPSVATLFVCLAPFWVAVFSSVVGKKRLSRAGWAGLALAVAGAGTLALARGGLHGISIGAGELFGLGASFCYASYTVALGRARETLSAGKALAPSIVSAVTLFGLAAWAVGDPFTGFPLRAVWAFVGLGLVVQTLAWLAISWGLGHVDARIGALSLLVQPVATMVLAFGLLGERLGPTQLVGAALVLAGIAVVADPARALADA